jgi:fluoride exporter
MSFVALWASVGVLGGVGAIVRFVLDGLISGAADGSFPLGTLLVNVSGAVVLGVLVGAAVQGDAYLLSATATIGSYTTFSTWMLESHRLAEDGRRWLLGANVLLSLTAGLAAVEVGKLLGMG